MSFSLYKKKKAIPDSVGSFLGGKCVADIKKQMEGKTCKDLEIALGFQILSGRTFRTKITQQCVFHYLFCLQIIRLQQLHSKNISMCTHEMKALVQHTKSRNK